ncbi:MAG TPA: serine protease [Kofleriaceae bacterium]|nr:serine protease [Kofleriaceae bacterium]
MGRREDFMAGLAPLQDDAVPPLHRDIKQLFANDAAFTKWEDSLWLGLFFARRLTGVLANRPRVESDSPAGRIQSFLEVAQGRGAFFGPQTLLRDLPFAIRRTCCVRIDGSAMGTGFLIGPDLVITNWHVVRAILKPEEHPERVSVAFDYLHEAGVGEPPISLAATKITRWRPARQEFLPGAEPSPHPLDYAVLKLAATLPGERGFFNLESTPDLATGSRVVIVGHPEGKPLAVSFSRSAGLHGLDGALAYYDADTLHGSSGSLVLLESQNELKAALLHAGGKTADENFGIHLRAIHDDLQGIVSSEPAAPTKPAPKLESFFGSEPEQRAGQLATLLSVLPHDVKLDTTAPVSQQIESLEAQWDERFAEALQIARAVAVPVSDERIAEVSTHETPVAPKPEQTVGAQTARKLTTYIVMSALVVVTALIVIPKLFKKDKPPPPQATETCGITQSSYFTPQRRELECSLVPTKQPGRIQCSLHTLQGGTIHGECYHNRPSGEWSSVTPTGEKLWSVDFEKGEWEVPYTYENRIKVKALERRTGADWEVESRSYPLPLGSDVVELPKQHVTRIRCPKVDASAELRDGGDRVGFTIQAGNTTLDADTQHITYRGTQVASSQVDADKLSTQFKYLWSQIEQCHPIAIEAPSCKLGTWDAGCGNVAGPHQDCFQHLDAMKSVDLRPCGVPGALEIMPPPGTPVISGDAAKALSPTCRTVLKCTAPRRPIPDLHVTPRIDPYVATLKSRVTFPIGKCKSAEWDAPKKSGDKWSVTAKCLCGDGTKTPAKVVASFTNEADMPAADPLTARFKLVGNQCGL